MAGWDKVGAGAAVTGVAVGVGLNLIFLVWSTSQLYYRVDAGEEKLVKVETKLDENQKVVSLAVIAETKISTQIEDLKSLIDRLIAREDDRERTVNNYRK